MNDVKKDSSALGLRVQGPKSSVAERMQGLKKIFKDKKYPILIDQEGGRVNRLKNIISFDNLTSELFGKKYIKNFREFKFYYKLFVDKTSYLLRSIGVNINTCLLYTSPSPRDP